MQELGDGSRRSKKYIQLFPMFVDEICIPVNCPNKKLIFEEVNVVFLPAVMTMKQS